MKKGKKSERVLRWVVFISRQTPVVVIRALLRGEPNSAFGHIHVYSCMSSQHNTTHVLQEKCITMSGYGSVTFLSGGPNFTWSTAKKTNTMRMNEHRVAFAQNSGFYQTMKSDPTCSHTVQPFPRSLYRRTSTHSQVHWLALVGVRHRMHSATTRHLSRQ